MVSPGPPGRPIARGALQRLLPPRSSALSTAVFAVVFTVTCSSGGPRPPSPRSRCRVPTPPRFQCLRCRSRRSASCRPARPAPAGPAAGDAAAPTAGRPRRTPPAPPPSCSRCSTRRRPSPSSGTRPRTTLGRTEVRARPPCAPRSTRPGPPSTPPAATRSSYRQSGRHRRAVHVRERATSTSSTRCWPAGRRRSTWTRCRPWRLIASDARVGAGAADSGGRPHPAARRTTPTRPRPVRRRRPTRPPGPSRSSPSRKRDADRRIDEAEAPAPPAEPRSSCATTTARRWAARGPIVRQRRRRPRHCGRRQGRLGKAYRWGAEGPRNFDCSGLTSWSFRQAGITLPAVEPPAGAGGHAGVLRRTCSPATSSSSTSPVSHVGIYAGGGKMLHAPQTGDVVQLRAGRSDDTFSGARRL